MEIEALFFAPKFDLSGFLSVVVFTRHTNEEVLKGHYIASQYTAARLNDLNLFNDSQILNNISTDDTLIYHP